MYYKAILVFLMILLFQKVYSQETIVKVGANISYFTSIIKPELAFHAGVSGALPLSETMSFRPEFVLSVQGSGRSYEFIDDNIWYVNLPMGFQYRRSRIFWRFGPQVGTIILVSDKAAGTETVISSYSPVDLSIFLGFGILVTKKLDVELRYNKGLNKVISEYSNVVWQLSLHYRFNKANENHE